MEPIRAAPGPVSLTLRCAGGPCADGYNATLVQVALASEPCTARVFDQGLAAEFAYDQPLQHTSKKRD